MSQRLLFGVYPGGVTGDDSGGLASGPPDDPERVAEALDLLQGRPERPFLVRAYTAFDDSTGLGGPHATAAPEDTARYAVRGRRLDLVAQYRSAAGDVDGYCQFLRELVDQYGSVTSTLQVTEEPNETTNPVLDGCHPSVWEAIVRGVAAILYRCTAKAVALAPFLFLARPVLFALVVLALAGFQPAALVVVASLPFLASACGQEDAEQHS